MASNYTAHYGLSQWKATDDFVREEFNQDNAKLDTAIRAAQVSADKALEGLVPIGYNVYNLFLQNYYEGKQTGFKKALVFDGFTDASMIASTTAGLVRIDNKLGLMRTGQGDISMGVELRSFDITTTVSSPICTATGYGSLTGAVVKTKNLISEGETLATFTVVAKVNGNIAKDSQVSLYCNANSQIGEQTLYFAPYPLKPGDRIQLTMRCANSNHHLVLTDLHEISGRFKVTPNSASVGTMTTPVCDLPQRERLRAWVRHKNGVVTLTARSGDTTHPMTPGASRQTVNLQGGTCTEQEFVLDPAPTSGPLGFTLGLDLGVAESMEIYDYGVMLL